MKCNMCNKEEFESFKRTFNFNNMEISIPVHKCLECGKEYIDNSVPNEVKKIILNSKIKEKRDEILNFLETHSLKCSLKEKREQKGLSQSEVAKRAGVTTQRINSLENKALNVKLETAFRIALSIESSLLDVWNYEENSPKSDGNNIILREKPRK